MKPSHRNRLLALFTALATISVLSACGGAGGGGVSVADGGIRGTGSSVGPVSGFGSVFVNGVEFDTGNIPNPVVQSNDGISFESELSEGMIVRVEGEWRTNGQGTADQLHYDDTLRGSISSLAADPSGAQEFVTVVVMGQSVRVDRQTVVRGTTFVSLLAENGVGDHVRISAWRQADGSYRAGYLGVITADLTNVELEGTVSGLDTDLNRFSIGPITVEYDENSVSFGAGLTESDLSAEGALEVEGSLAGNTLTASTIDRDDARRFRRGSSDEIEFTVLIDSVDASLNAGNRPGEFTVGDLTVRVTDATELDDGLTLADLQPDLLVQVEGRFLSDTLVVAEEIERRDGDASVQGVIAFTDIDRFEIGGVEVRVTVNTVFIEDDGDPVSFDSLPVGDTLVEVQGFEALDGSQVYISALNVEVDDELADQAEQEQFELEGRLRNITQNPGFISVLGIQLGDTTADYDDVVRGDLVEALEDGEVVRLEVEYSDSGTGFVAEEIELEED